MNAKVPTKKRELTNGVVIERLVASHLNEREAVATARVEAEEKARAQHKKRRADLLAAIDPSRHAAITAGVDAMLKVLAPGETDDE